MKVISALHRSIIALATLALVSSACQPGGAPGPAAQATPATTAAPAATPAPKAGGTITIDTGANKIASLDPARIRVTVEQVSATQVVEPLIFRTADLKLVPRLARSWRVEPDKVTWTIQLRSGVKFSDGTPFNAAALKANFDRWMDPKDPSQVGPELRRAFESIEIVDSETVRLRTKGPQPHVAELLVGHVTAIISPAQLEKAGRFGDAIGVAPIGTGPFKVGSFVPGEKLELVRNDEYWGDKPFLDKVVWLSVPDASARTAALLTGQTDLAFEMATTQVAQFRSKDGFALHLQPTWLQFYALFNVRKPYLQDPRVRIAINHAVDMNAVKEIAFEGLAAPYQGPTNPSVFRPDPPLEGLKYDQQRARQLLQDAGATDLKLKLVYTTALPARLGEVIQAQLREVGITVDLVRVDQAAATALRDKGDFDMAFSGIGHSTGVAFVHQRFSHHSQGGDAKHTGYNNPKVDRLLDDAAQEVDEKKRSDLMTQVFREHFANPVSCCAYHTINAFVVSTKIKGFEAHPQQIVPISKMWLDR